MARDNRQILINLHSAEEKVPVGVLNLGEIAVQHNNVDDAALYVETVADSNSAETVAKFITEKAVEARISSAITDLQSELQVEIDSINEAVGLPHDPEAWDSGMTVWDAIEHTYQEMTAGTAAANTKLELDDEDEKYLALRAEKDDATSSVTYYIKSQGIDERVDSAVSIVNNIINELADVVEALSAGTESEVERLDDKVDELSAATEEAIADLEDQIEEIEAEINANEVSSEDGSIVVTPTTGGTDLKVNIDGKSIVLNDNNELVADLKLSAITPSEARVKEEYALINHEGVQLGDSIKIYKDSSLYNVYLGHVDDELVAPDDPTVVPGSGDTALCFIYEKSNGEYQLVAIDVEDFLQEHEFADGLEVNNHVVSVKVDEESEEVEIASGETAPILSVGPDGVKISNIQNAINYAAELLEQKVEELNDELDTVEESLGLGPNGEFIAPASGYASGATTMLEGLEAISEALEEVSEKLNASEVFETGSTENWVTLTVEEVEPGKTGLTLDDSALAEELVDIRNAAEAEADAREMADNDLYGNSSSTSAETSLMGLKKLIETLTTTLNADAVQDAEFAVLSDDDRDSDHCNAGLKVVENGDEGQKIQLDLSLLKVDCGQY